MAYSYRQMTGLSPNLHTMVPRSACTQWRSYNWPLELATPSLTVWLAYVALI